MLSTPNTSANCGDDSINIKSDTVDAEKNEIGGESAPGNPMLTPPGLEGCQAPSSEGYQELSLLNEEQRDLSESLPRSSGSAKSTSRESKSLRMR